MGKGFVTEANPLPPGEPVPGFASARAGERDAGLAAERAEHDGDLSLYLGECDRVIGVNRIGRGRADQAMPRTADGLLQLEKIQHRRSPIQ